MARTWIDQLQVQLVKQFGKNKGATLNKKYSSTFPLTYQEDFSAIAAVDDITSMEQLSEQNPLEINFYQEERDGEKRLYLKLIQFGKPIPLSDVLPMLENMDLRTYNERPYKIVLEKNNVVWIDDFSVSSVNKTELNLEKIKAKFRDTLISTYLGIAENDGFNKLVLGAGLSWREISILRAYAKYLHQTGFHFSQAYIEKTLAAHPDIASDLVNLFLLKFDPKQAEKSAKQIDILSHKIQISLESVTSLDEDRILRHVWEIINVTLRTNYFQTTESGTPKSYFSFKLNSAKVPDLPLPRPLFEIFVYSPRFEGIHLRNAKVSRGGIRWSDRREDFRTEILGLMKAQKVKNAVIVPSGAKGGFVLKCVPVNATRDVIQKEVVACYKDFIRGLLDLTDNLQKGKVIRPTQVVCYDEEDTYLVVAADKGTATFSDTANSIAKEYGFWLGDAFASGGSAGYDHKKMGITARGAWESVKRHFRELDISIEQDDFTVVGIGDMSGDVFGNGMLYSDHIKLIAAFDHRDIFIDPNPDAKKSFAERLRLFNLPTSSWQDYNPKLISKGGGVFKRSSKSIPLSAELKKILGIDNDSLTPNELIRELLKAPVDLLFNGGIGTYVKASTESHADAGDKTNEYCRINGNQLRCRVVGEGGNLGFTQLGRVEYALLGGLISTDFIDNSAGVDCSDHEVNIKILLNKEMLNGKLTEKKRNQLLVRMTDEIAQLVLQDNYNQALAMSYSADHADKLAGLYQTYLRDLEAAGVVDRAVEFLPDEKTILDRRTNNKGLVRPEIAVLLAYTKMSIKHEILQSDLPEDPYLSEVIETAFPKTLCKLYKNEIQKHPLRREIIATQLSNQIVNEMGITFVYRLQIETGASIRDVIRAHSVASQIFGTKELQTLIDSLDRKIPAKMQFELFHYVRTLINLATRWFLRGKRLQDKLPVIISHYTKGVNLLKEHIPNMMLGVTKTYLESITEHFVASGLSKEIAKQIAITRAIYTALNVIEVATQHSFDLYKTAQTYFDVGGRFHLVWFRDQISADNREGHWNALARLTLRDELDILQRLLTVAIIKNNKKEKDGQQLIEQWVTKNAPAIERWEKVQELLHSSAAVDYAMFFIALRELSNWLNASA